MAQAPPAPVPRVSAGGCEVSRERERQAAQAFRERRLISRSTASRTKARASSSGANVARMRSRVPSANEVRNFSGQRSVRPNFRSVSHIRYVDTKAVVSHIRFQDNRGREMTNLTELTDTQLRARHLLFIADARAAQSAGSRDEAYRLAMEVRRMNGEIALRRMLAAA